MRSIFAGMQNLVQGGSLLLYRPGTGAMHKLPDALSRHPPTRDALNIARIGDWTKFRHVTRGVQASIDAEARDGDEDPQLYHFDISELGGPIWMKELLAKKFQSKEKVDIGLSTFDVTGREVHTKDYPGVYTLDGKTIAREIKGDTL